VKAKATALEVVWTVGLFNPACFLTKYLDTNSFIYHILSNPLLETQIGDKGNVIQQTGGSAMVMPSMPVKANCPQCGSENIGTKWTLVTAIAWICRLLGVHAVRTYDKKCETCGNEFRVYRK